MDNRPIGIFDSGVGGITILKEIQKRLPNENYIYLGDTKNFPYGEKNREEIIKFAIQNVEYLIKKNVKIIVIACGTATSQAIDILQQKFEIPIIGIIKPTVEYIKEKEYKEVGVIATEGTIRSGEWERQLRKNISNINVINKACPMLATIAEEGRATGIEGRNAIKEYMKSFKEKKINKIILGCTHFPIYEQVIRDELKYDVELINTGKTVAKYLEEYLNEKELYTQSKKGNRILKVIIETCLLTDEEKIKMCELVTESGADFIKTSTGFSTGGATREDIALFAKHVGKNVKIKAAGGIKTLEDAEAMIDLGATRLGTSRIVKIVKEQNLI